MTNQPGKIEDTVSNTFGLRTWIANGFKPATDDLGRLSGHGLRCDRTLDRTLAGAGHECLHAGEPAKRRRCGLGARRGRTRTTRSGSRAPARPPAPRRAAPRRWRPV